MNCLDEDTAHSVHKVPFYGWHLAWTYSK